MVRESELKKPLNVKDLLKDAEQIAQRVIVDPQTSEPVCRLTLSKVTHRVEAKPICARHVWINAGGESYCRTCGVPFEEQA